MKNCQRTYAKFVKMEFQEAYPSYWAIGGALIGSFLSLVIYWFTSKAFTPAMKDLLTIDSIDYFNFVFSGELVLILPLVLIQGTIQVVRYSIASGTIYTFLALPTRTETPLLYWALAKLPNEGARFLIMVSLAALTFGFHVGPMKLLALLGFIFCTLPFFLSLGLLSAAILVLFGRGERAIGFLLNLLTMISGLYFPTVVLPEVLQNAVKVLSPFHFILSQSREILYGRSMPALSVCLSVFGFGLASLAFGLYCLHSSFEKIRSRGQSFLLRH